MRDSRTRVANGLHALGWILFAGVPASLFAPGCQGRECESAGYSDYGYNPGEGHAVGTDTWESSPQQGPWIVFGPYKTWGFHPQSFVGREITSIVPYISADQNPNANSNFTIAAGNQAIITISSDSSFVFVTNATCAPEYIRVVMTFAPGEPPPLDGDAGNPADDGGGTSDSGVDLDAGDGGD